MELLDLAEELGCREILRSIDKRADVAAIFAELPEDIKRHSKRVAELTVAVMEHANERCLFADTEYGLDLHPGYMEYLYEAALHHDIGKAFLPRRLIEEQEPLTAAEQALFHMHVQLGDCLFMPLEPPLMINENLRGEPLRRYMAQACAAFHHEFIGSEPLQIGHEPADTPIWAQVCGIANLWDNLLHGGMDGKVYTEAGAAEWMEDNQSLFTDEAYGAVTGYLNIRKRVGE